MKQTQISDFFKEKSKNQYKQSLSQQTQNTNKREFPKIKLKFRCSQDIYKMEENTIMDLSSETIKLANDMSFDSDSESEFQEKRFPNRKIHTPTKQKSPTKQSIKKVSKSTCKKQILEIYSSQQTERSEEIFCDKDVEKHKNLLTPIIRSSAQTRSEFINTDFISSENTENIANNSARKGISIKEKINVISNVLCTPGTPKIILDTVLSTSATSNTPSFSGTNNISSTFSRSNVPSTSGIRNTPPTRSTSGTPSPSNNSNASSITPSIFPNSNAPSTSGAHNAPSTSGTHNAPSTSGMTNTPCTTGTNNAPSISGKGSAAHITGTNKSPSTSSKSTAASASSTNNTPFTSATNNAAFTFGRNNVGSTSGKQIQVRKTVYVQSEKLESSPIEIIQVRNPLLRKSLNIATQTSEEDFLLCNTKNVLPNEKLDDSEDEIRTLPKKRKVRRKLYDSTDESFPKKQKNSKTKQRNKCNKHKENNQTKYTRSTQTIKKRNDLSNTESSSDDTCSLCSSLESDNESLGEKQQENACQKKFEMKFTSNNKAEMKEAPKTQTFSPKKKVEMKITSPNKKTADDETKAPEKREKYTLESHKRTCENVKNIVQWVFENAAFRVLFCQNEVEMLKNLFEMQFEYTVVCLRLYTRQHRFYHLSHLCNELNLGLSGSQLKHLEQTLRDKKFVKTDYSEEPLPTLLNYLSRNDVKNICSSFKLKLPTQKSAMIIKLLENCTTQSRLSFGKSSQDILRDHITQKMGICVRLDPEFKEVLNRIHILYSFTNPDIETTHNIYDLMYKLRNGILKYPEVTLSQTDLFYSRSYFLRFVEAYKMRNELKVKKAQKEIHQQYILCDEALKRFTTLLACEDMVDSDKAKPLYLRRFSPGWIFAHILTLGSESLSQHHSKDVCVWLDTLLKQDVYCVHKRGHWYNQLALIKQSHLKDICSAVKHISDGLQDNLVNEIDKHELSIRGSKIRKPKLPQLEIDLLQRVLLPKIDDVPARTIQANIVHGNESGRKLMFVKNTANGKEYTSVEETAIRFYKEEGLYTDGVHCEGRVFHTIFFILFWDIILIDNIPNTFLTKLQSLPLDLFSGEFYSNRSAQIDERLKNIRESWSYDDLCSFISNTLQNKELEISSISASDFVREDLLHMFVRCITKPVLAAVCKRLVTHYKQFRSGLPDLFLWNKRELKACYVEVKSEKDKLSVNQMLWLNYLKHFGARVEVCHVQNIGSSSGRK